jgi:hypothetical protein
MTIFRFTLTGLVPLMLAAAPVAGQDTATVPEGPRAERLRQLIEDRFAERLKVELGLTDEQVPKVHAILGSWAAKRRALEREDRALRQGLAAAMRPGVAAEERAVTRVTDRLLAARVEYVETFRGELAELASILSPVQRAQYVLLRDRLLQRVQEIRNQRAAGSPPRLLNRLRR